MRAPCVLTIPPACPFLDTFVRGLLAGDVVPGFAPGLAREGDPLALSDVTIYVPTQRAAGVLGGLFADHRPGQSAVLPRILPLGALESTETELVFAEPEPGAAAFHLPPAASSVWRRLQLARLIQGWAKAVDGALRSIDRYGTPITDPSEAFRVATSTTDAFALAGDLAALIDELLIEGVAWHALDALEMASFDDYWRITTTFLQVAFAEWPKVLAQHGMVDAAARQIALVDAQATLLTGSTAGTPVVAIGSTGTNKATARLLAAIARAPRGAVVLPGLDLDLEEEGWRIVGGNLQAGEEPGYSHPQAAMARLLPILGIERADVRVLGTPTETAAARDRFVAEALRPADTTDRWRIYRRSVGEADLAVALAGVRVIEAADEREEALCLAIAMREVLETPGRTAALVTPDRDLARRVRGELLRWDVEVTDSGGEPLAKRPLGILARLVAAAAAPAAGAPDLSALLAHPLADFGDERGEVARLASLCEIGVLRAVPLADRSAEDLFAMARTIAADRHSHPAQQAIAAADWTAMRDLWRRLEDALAPLAALDGEQPLAAWVAAHRASLSAVVGAAADDETDALEALFAELTPAADSGLRFDAEGYGLFFGRLAGEATLRNTDRPHPRLRIYGLLEARLMTADVVLLAGLDETVWPPQPKSDPFLNRPMRGELKLLPPERRIGQTAHDFAQAMGNAAVVLSRAAKRGGSPCVPSRFLLRMEALAGVAWRGCRDRGAETLRLARLIDSTPQPPRTVARPSPRPAVSLRPQQLSVTQIETLRRDPYAVFASRILKLAPLPAVGGELDPSEFGSLMHEALRRFVDAASDGATADERRETLREIVHDAFASVVDDPLFRAFRWPIIEKTMAVFLLFDAKQRETVRHILTEKVGRLDIALTDGSSFALTARADRIDLHRDGSATLIDYKTGQPPGLKEIEVGFAPQLTLEAAMLRHGGFGRAHGGAIAATYLKLGGKDGGGIRKVTFKGLTLDEVVERHFTGLQQLLSSFRSVETGYPSRPFPKFAKRYGSYDHLARVREWSLAGDEDRP